MLFFMSPIPIGLHAEINCLMPLPPLCGFLYPGSCRPIAWSVWSEWPFECMVIFLMLFLPLKLMNPQTAIHQNSRFAKWCGCKLLNNYHVYINNDLDSFQSKAVAKHLETHLLAWQHLAARCHVKKFYLYKMRPKHHYLDHIQRDVARTCLNPRKTMTCFSDESFLGCLKRIGVRCHQANMMERLFQRYVLFLSLRWNDTKWLPVFAPKNWVPAPTKTWEKGHAHQTRAYTIRNVNPKMKQKIFGGNAVVFFWGN